jgi:hypothetical protein
MSLGLCIILVASQLVGCGDPYRLAKVRGRVTTCEGKPAVGGEIIFQPIDAPEETGRPKGNSGTMSRGTVKADGTFHLKADLKQADGALIGPHRVLFKMPPTKRPVLTAEERLSMSPQEIQQVEEDFKRRPVYAPLPCSANLSPDKVDVKPGSNEFEFSLLSK